MNATGQKSDVMPPLHSGHGQHLLAGMAPSISAGGDGHFPPPLAYCRVQLWAPAASALANCVIIVLCLIVCSDATHAHVPSCR